MLGLEESNRRVNERRLYRDGINLEGRTDFGRPADPYYASDSAVLVDKLDAAGTTLLAREKHYFYAGTSVSNNTFEYSHWLAEKEYKTEEIDTANCTLATCASVLKRVEYTWQLSVNDVRAFPSRTL